VVKKEKLKKTNLTHKYFLATALTLPYHDFNILQICTFLVDNFNKLQTFLTRWHQLHWHQLT